MINKIKKLVPVGVRKSLKNLLSFNNSVNIQSLNYYCPVCDAKVAGFTPLPSFYIEEMQKYGWPYSLDELETLNWRQYTCPACSASDRDRLFALYMRKRLFPLKPAVYPTVIEFAPSLPLQNFIKKFEVAYRSADLFMQGVDDTVDITDMTIYPENFCDIFICSHILEHVSDDKKALAELYRILKPGGWGIVMVPVVLTINDIDEDPSVTDVGEKWRRFGQYDHVRLYSKSEFIERVQQAGFNLKQITGDCFNKNEIAKFGIAKQSVLYIVEK